jgi:crossover junction endodeoxyribonuclease RuvC
MVGAMTLLDLATTGITRTNILGIDSSLTSSGMCRINHEIYQDGVTRWNTEVWCIPSKPGEDRSPAGMSNRIAEIITAMEPHIAAADMVVLEGVSFASTGTAAHALHWLWGRIVDTTQANATELVIATPSQRMQYATGKGQATKDAVLAAVIRRWPDVLVENNDQADALVMAAIGARALGIPIDDVPKSHWEKVMAKVNAQ